MSSNDDRMSILSSEFDSQLGNNRRQKQYNDERSSLIKKEQTTSWESRARASASSAEQRANDVVWKIREHERDNLFGNKASEAIPGKDTLDMGGQFLTNRTRIKDRSRLFKIACEAPKGCHLHLHFNAELPPKELVERAATMETMYIRATKPLLSKEDLTNIEVVFCVLPADTPEADLFAGTYSPEWKNTTNNAWMKWKTFRKHFNDIYSQDAGSADEWLRGFLVLGKHEVYSEHQTVNG